MKDYLSHLIRRMQGEPPAIRPSLPSRFERPAELKQSAVEIPAAVPARNSPDRREQGGGRDAQAHPPMTPLTKDTKNTKDTALTTDTPMTPQQRRPAGKDTDAMVARLSLVPTSGAAQKGAPQDPEVAGSTEQRVSGSTEQARQAPSATGAARKTPRPPEARVAKPVAARLFAANVRPSRSATPPEEPHHAERQAIAPRRRNPAPAATGLPLIHVSIGRVDVRADLSRAAEPRPEPSARAPLPLADYLKGRESP